MKYNHGNCQMGFSTYHWLRCAPSVSCTTSSTVVHSSVLISMTLVKIGIVLDKHDNYFDHDNDISWDFLLFDIIIKIIECHVYKYFSNNIKSY